MIYFWFLGGGRRGSSGGGGDVGPRYAVTCARDTLAWILPLLLGFWSLASHK